MTDTDQWTHVDHPEDERFDEVHITCVERWKESEISGDEWRFNYFAQIKRKGEVIIEFTAAKLDWILSSMQWRMLIAGEEGNIDLEAWNRTKDCCDQPGCARAATSYFKRLKRYTKQGEEMMPNTYSNEFRKFCASHKNRGDCDMDDADHNYEPIPEHMLPILVTRS